MNPIHLRWEVIDQFRVYVPYKDNCRKSLVYTCKQCFYTTNRFENVVGEKKPHPGIIRCSRNLWMSNLVLRKVKVKNHWTVGEILTVRQTLIRGFFRPKTTNPVEVDKNPRMKEYLCIYRFKYLYINEDIVKLPRTSIKSCYHNHWIKCLSVIVIKNLISFLLICICGI